MRKKLYIIMTFLIIGSTLIVLPTKSLANSTSSSGTSTGSITLYGWGDIEQPTVNQPVGPQGDSTLKTSSAATDQSDLPQTNEVSSYWLSIIGWLWLLILLLLYLIYRTDREERGGSE